MPPDDAPALATAIEQAYLRKHDLEELGLRGRDYVKAHHSRQAVACRYDALIRELTDGR